MNAPGLTAARRRWTVHGAATQRLFSDLLRLGLPAAAIFSEAGLRPIHRHGAARAVRDAFVAAKGLAARHLDDPCLGFRLAEELDHSKMEGYGALLANARTVGEAIRFGVQYLPVWEQGTHCELTISGPAARITYHFDALDPLDGRIECQTAVLFLTNVLRRLVPGESTGAVTIGCADVPPVHARCRRALHATGCRLEFHARAWFIELPARWLERPVPHHPAARQILLEHVGAQRAEVQPEGLTATEGVRLALEEGLSLGWGLTEVADRLGVAPRTLQKALSAAGSSFAVLRREVQLARAVASLEAGQRPGEVAAAVGFNSPAAFSRFVVRWTGRTPSAIAGGRAQASRGRGRASRR